MACATRPYARLPWILISWVITGLTISWALKHGEICARASSKSPATFAESTSKLGDSPTSRQCTPSPERAARLFKESNTRDSDKIGLHRYHLMYGPFLAPYLNKSMRLLEIGVFNGASLALWENLFPHHEKIVGLGYGVGSSVAKAFKSKINKKVVLYTGDQSDGRFLKRMKKDLGNDKFDLIIDDGSHVPWHQIFTLEQIFDSWLKEGGLYIIEDIETSYWDHRGAKLYGVSLPNAGIGRKGNAVEKLKGVIDVINRKMLGDHEYSVLNSKVDLQVSHIAFSQNCVMLWKKNFPEQTDWKLIEREYGRYSSRGLDPKRTHYREYLQKVGGHSWNVTGTPKHR